MVEVGREANVRPLLRRVNLARVCARYCWKGQTKHRLKSLLILHLATDPHLAFALTSKKDVSIHEALVARLRRREEAVHRHASRAIPSRSCRYRSSFTSSGSSHSPRYVAPASCVTEAA
jgi:hypothetical protein